MITARVIVTILIIMLHPSVQMFGQGGAVFPGLSGFGLDTKGGRGGRIIRVTNLNRDGAGSLNEAIKATGPRIVVFEVAGIIDLDGRSYGILNPYITIAGQTAPSPGITLIKGGINIGANEVIIQHIRVRPGEAGKEKASGWDIDGISTFEGSYNVIIDHCSISWSTDENLSASGPQFKGADVKEWRKNTSHNIVFSNCLIAEALSKSTHTGGEHSKGTLIHDNATGILIYRNLYSSNVERNPLFSGGSQGLVINNYIYNPGYAAIQFIFAKSEWTGHKLIPGIMVVEGNYIECGPDSRSNISGGAFRGPVELYWKDNLIKGGPMVTELSGDYKRLFERPFFPEGLNVLPSAQVKDYVLNNCGAYPWDRDETDRRIVENIRLRKAKIINSERETEGYPILKPVFRRFNENEWDLSNMVMKAGRDNNLQ
ncbi:MAG TPA: hypothetical protein VK213_06455 [Bacteroidales bacterium]|nr:hypothetical protein [Bacteroidales bacterium]